MPHPDGGRGSFFHPKKSFEDAYNFIGLNGFIFTSTTGEKIKATRSSTKSGLRAITFDGERSKHGNVCKACWGYIDNCSGAHIGQCSRALDKCIQ